MEPRQKEEIALKSSAYASTAAHPDPDEFDAEIDADQRADACPPPWEDALDAEEERAREPHAELDNPFTQVDEWWRTGPERTQAHADGRTSSSAQLSHQEAVRPIDELTAQLQRSIT